ncbi:MAG: hypothetical protein ABI867_09200 [Kofleriaceae bacterium]
MIVVGCGDDKNLGDDIPDGPQCSDGVDNDGDGTIDFPADLGCEGPADNTEDSQRKAACEDHRDNDGDGKADYPEDPGCIIPQSDSEEDDCPDGPACPQCGNGRDDNNNGVIDFPADPGCESAGDPTEFLDDPAACGTSLTITGLPINGMATGMLDGTSTSMLSTTCGGGGGAAGVAYLFHLAEPKVVIATTDVPGTMVDTVIDIRSADCDAADASIACNDDNGTHEASSLTQSLAAGSYYLIVEGHDTSELGPFSLKVEFFAGEGEMCMAQSDCGPGLVCRAPVGTTQMICTDPVCSDGLDDDGDGKIDFPDDPGCSDPADSSETDDCPSGPLCPACSDGVDNDLDGQTDFPADLACSSASSDNEACAGEQDSIDPIVAGTTAGTLIGATDEHDPTCGGNGGVDKLYTLDVPEMATLVVDTNGSIHANTVLSIMTSACTEPGLECDDNDGDGNDSLITRTNVAPGTYIIAVDAFSNTTAQNTFVVNVHGTVVPGASCESALFQTGAFSCTAGFACKGTVGSRTCAPAECNDNLDNNSDGVTDFPDDPGCESTSDDTETTVCPGASCPVCSDGLDNDNDGQIDYPADNGCISASADNEGCAGEQDDILEIVAETTTGTLVGASDDHDPVCVTSNFPDKIFKLEIPTLSTLVIDTEGSVVDTVLSLMTSACTEPALACDDDGGVGVGDSLISRSFIAGGVYTIAVDADTATLGTFNLNIHGTIITGGSCEGLLFDAGALTCASGFACIGTPGSRTCRAAECQDGIDNNGDGRQDFPLDPGCESPSDNSEDTVCPGPLCPVCSDGIDNDGDGRTDFPADSGCFTAADTNEACAQSEAVAVITQRVTTGTTLGQVNDFYPSCGTTGTHTAADVALELDLPVAMASLKLTLGGLAGVHALLDSTCGGTPIACSDPALMELTSVAAGTYYVVVDGFSTVDGDFTLETTGEVAPGGSCESVLFQSGAFTCTSGFACSGTVGSRTCVTAQCNDGVDNNSDGVTDFPDDPGCDTISDNTETTVCPGPLCPACSDGTDNDGDGTTDYPADPSCFAASGTTESCSQTEPIAVITQKITAGTTIGQTNDFTPTCGTTTGHTAPDVALQLDLPKMQSLNLNLVGFAAGTHVLLDASCGGAPLACSDPPNMAVGAVAAGRYFVIVDGFSTAASAFTLDTTGVIAPGGSCESPLFTAGAITCPVGLACIGTPGARTCFSECADGVDNNGNGFIDFPFDPGCTSPTDAIEEVVVCPGPTCPACSNAADDDADGLTDFPSDFGCTSAGGTTEVLCPIETTPATLITLAQTAGTLAAPAIDNYEQTCQASTGNDVAYGLQLPVPVKSLVIDTLGSVNTDTVLSLWDASCGVQLGCDDDGAPGSDLRSVLTVGDVAAGNYAIQVDSFGTTHNTAFVLNVKGTVAAGTSCTSPLFAAGVLVCPTGTTCNGTCQ